MTEINFQQMEADMQARIQQEIKDTNTLAKSCAVRASNELRNAVLNVLRVLERLFGLEVSLRPQRIREAVVRSGDICVNGLNEGAALKTHGRSPRPFSAGAA